MLRFAAFALLCLAVGVVAYVSPTARTGRRSEQALTTIEQFQEDGEVHLQALRALFADDCGGTNHSPSNGYPLELLEPHGYTSAPLLDPFGPAGETVRFIQQHNSGNCSLHLFVSRGPDGDWDMDRLSTRRAFAPMVLLNDGPVTYTKHDGTLRTTTPEVVDYSRLNDESRKPEYEILEYTDRHGVVHKIERTEAIVLPGHPNDAPWFHYDDLIRVWATDGVSVYDPTNGALSDGDLLLVDPLLYERVKAD